MNQGDILDLLKSGKPLDLHVEAAPDGTIKNYGFGTQGRRISAKSSDVDEKSLVQTIDSLRKKVPDFLLGMKTPNLSYAQVVEVLRALEEEAKWFEGDKSLHELVDHFRDARPNSTVLKDWGLIFVKPSNVFGWEILRDGTWEGMLIHWSEDAVLCLLRFSPKRKLEDVPEPAAKKAKPE